MSKFSKFIRSHHDQLFVLRVYRIRCYNSVRNSYSQHDISLVWRAAGSVFIVATVVVKTP